MKNLQNLKGAKTLSKKEQRNVVGGSAQMCYYQNDCPEPLICTYFSVNSAYGWCLIEPV